MNTIWNGVTCWWYKERQTGGIPRERACTQYGHKNDFIWKCPVLASFLTDFYPYIGIGVILSFESKKILTLSFHCESHHFWQGYASLCQEYGVDPMSDKSAVSPEAQLDGGYHISLLQCRYLLWGPRILVAWFLYAPFIIPVPSYFSFLLFNFHKCFLFLQYCLNFFVYFDHILKWYFMWLLMSVRTSGSLIFKFVLEIFFICWFAFFQLYAMICIFSYCILFCYVMLSHLETCSFLMGDRKETDADGRRQGRTGRNRV